MEILKGKQFRERLCDALGIEMDGVFSISIHAEVDAAAYIIAKKYITTDQAGQIETEMKRYNLIKAGDVSE